MNVKIYKIVNRDSGLTQMVETTSALQALKIATALPYEVHPIDAVEARTLMREGVEVLNDFGLKPDAPVPPTMLVAGAYIGANEQFGVLSEAV